MVDDQFRRICSMELCFTNLFSPLLVLEKSAVDNFFRQLTQQTYSGSFLEWIVFFLFSWAWLTDQEILLPDKKRVIMKIFTEENVLNVFATGKCVFLGRREKTTVTPLVNKNRGETLTGVFMEPRKITWAWLMVHVIWRRRARPINQDGVPHW